MKTKIIESSKKDKESKISVIIPCYNCKKYIKDTIDSLIKQSYKDFDIIFVDDGSTDNTVDIILECLSKTDLKWKIIKQENLGVSVARNTGLENATSEYIMFIDSDDWIDEEMLYKMYINASKYNLDIVMCKYIMEKGKSSEKEYSYFNEDVFLYNSDIQNKILEKMIVSEELDKPAIMGSVWRLLINRRVIDENCIYFDKEVTFSEDLLFCLDLLKSSNSLLIMNEYLYHYRITDTSLTGKYDENFANKQEILNEKIKLKYPLIKGELGNRRRIFLSSVEIDNIMKCNQFNIYEKYKLIRRICNDKKLKEAFKFQNINNLKLSSKLKFICIKYNLSFIIVLYYLLIK